MDTGITRIMQALADPTRREILQLLSQGDLAAGEIAAHFTISAPSVSHHLNVLKQAELVQANRQGQLIIYSLNSTVMHDVLGYLMGLLQVGETKNTGSPPPESQPRKDSSDA